MLHLVVTSKSILICDTSLSFFVFHRLDTFEVYWSVIGGGMSFNFRSFDDFS